MFIAKSDLSGPKLAERIGDDFAWFVLGGQRVGIAEIEIIGAKALLDQRGDEIVRELRRIKREMKLDIVFQNTIELEGVQTFLVADEPETQQLLERTLNVRFVGIVAHRQEAIMRKQIVPLLKKALA